MRLQWTAGLVAVALCVGCNDSDEDAGPPPGGLEGRWVASEVEFVRVASPSSTVDIVPAGGSLVLDLAADNSFSLEFALPGEPVWPMAGTWHASTDVLTLSYTSGRTGVNQFDMTLSGDTLTLRGADTDFEFVEGGGAEPAKLNLVLARR